MRLTPNPSLNLNGASMSIERGGAVGVLTNPLIFGDDFHLACVASELLQSKALLNLPVALLERR